MAASNYYQDSSSQQYQSYRPSSPYQPSAYEQTQYPHHAQTAPSIAPTYHTNDPYDQRATPPPMNPTPTNTYSDNIPLSTQPRIETNNWQPTQNTAYPPSPESQQPHPAFLSSPTSRRKRKKKKGFFRGKVPWFVYTLTLIQTSVFIAEIIKNCKFEEPTSIRQC